MKSDDGIVIRINPSKLIRVVWVITGLVMLYWLYRSLQPFAYFDVMLGFLFSVVVRGLFVMMPFILCCLCLAFAAGYLKYRTWSWWQHIGFFVFCSMLISRIWVGTHQLIALMTFSSVGKAFQSDYAFNPNEYAVGGLIYALAVFVIMVVIERRIPESQ